MTLSDYKIDDIVVYRNELNQPLTIEIISEVNKDYIKAKVIKILDKGLGNILNEEYIYGISTDLNTFNIETLSLITPLEKLKYL